MGEKEWKRVNERKKEEGDQGKQNGGENDMFVHACVSGPVEAIESWLG